MSRFSSKAGLVGSLGSLVQRDEKKKKKKQKKKRKGELEYKEKTLLSLNGMGVTVHG